MTLYSHSRISTFEQCPLKYKFNYIDKVKVEFEQTIEAFMGGVVHDVLEKIYIDVKFCRIPSKDEILEFYEEKWDESWSGEIKIVKKNYSAKDYFNMGKKFLVDYYETYHPFNQTTVLSTEERILVSLGENEEYKLQGYIDRLDYAGDGIYEIHDYKTNSRIKLQEDVDEDRQLALYSIGIKNRFPDAKKVRLIWHFLAFNKELESHRTEEQLEKLKNEIIERIKEIENAKEFKPKEGALCGWCPYQKMCPSFSYLYKKECGEVPKSEEELIEEYSGLNEKKTEITKKLEELKEKIIEIAKKENVNVLYGSDHKIRISESEKLDFPSKGSEEREDLIKRLKELRVFEELSDIDRTSLFEKVKNDSEFYEKIKEFVNISESVRISVSKNKE